MDDQTDFARLYTTLGVSPGCSVDELRAAYRRLAARLHPDAGGRGEDIERLQQINRVYHAATQFHRMHGRLPGEAGPPASAPLRAASSGIVANPAAMPLPMAAPRRKLRSLMLAGVVVALLAWIAASPEVAGMWREASNDEAANDAGPATRAASTRGRKATQVAIGMAPSQVLAISGEPLSRGERRWDYGPSWVTYRCGVVSDWYSSPLRPIHPGASHPGEHEVSGRQASC